MATIKRRGLAGRGFYFGAGIAVGLGLAAHGAAASVIRTACRSGGTSKPPAAASRPAHQSTLFVGEGHRWQLTLTRVAVVPQVHDDMGTYRAQGKYVIVFMTAQNAGKAPQTIGFDQNFALTDAQGRQFGLASAEVNTTAYDQYKLDFAYNTQVQPTFSAHVGFVFDVAPDAHGLRLLNVPAFGGSTQKLFTLGL